MQESTGTNPIDTKRDPKRDTSQLVKGMIDLNPVVQVRDMARTLDVSTQRVYQITRALGLRQDATGKWVPAKKRSA